MTFEQATKQDFINYLTAKGYTEIYNVKKTSTGFSATIYGAITATDFTNIDLAVTATNETYGYVRLSCKDINNIVITDNLF